MGSGARRAALVPDRSPANPHCKNEGWKAHWASPHLVPSRSPGRFRTAPLAFGTAPITIPKDSTWCKNLNLKRGTGDQPITLLARRKRLDPPNIFNTGMDTRPRTCARFRYFELSLQSALHRSITLLVRYRFRASIEPCEGWTSPFKLQFQEALLSGNARRFIHLTARRSNPPWQSL